MNHRELENYLAVVSRLLRLTSKQRTQLQEELRDHLEFRVAELLEDGLSEEDAIQVAIEDFGDADVMANQFNEIAGQRKKRLTARFTVMATAVCFLLILFVFAIWPLESRFGAPNHTNAATDAIQNRIHGLNQNQNTENPNTPEKPEKPIAQPQPELVKIAVPLNIALQQRLRQIVSIEFEQTTLGEALEELNTLYQLNLVIPDEANTALISNQECRLTMRNVSLETALEHLLAPQKLTFLKRDGCVWLTLSENSSDAKYHERRILEISPHLTWLKKAADKANQNDGGLTTNAQLIQLISQSVSPDSWTETGGSGSLQIIGNILIVTNERAITNQVEEFLTELLHSIAPKSTEPQND